MLGLPIVTGLSGFFPSLSMLIIAWAFMTFTGLILVEASGWFSSEVNLLSMTEEALGRFAKLIAWLTYLFLFYSILVAYIAASGTIFSAILQTLFHIQVPAWAASLFFTFIFGWIIYLGTRPVDLVNRVLMIGLIAAYLGMILLGIFRIHPSLLLHWAPTHLFTSLPILVISFGFQNLIPSLTAYMKGDLRRMRTVILVGSSICLFVYLIWLLFVLGVVPHERILESYNQGEEATFALKTTLGSTSITYFAQGFAFFAIVTSFLAQGLTLTHFLGDGFKLANHKQNTRWLVLLTLLPPLIFSLSYPQIFFKALNFAGGICAMILFGILPTLMVWVGRYVKKMTSSYHVAAGKPSLIIAFFFSLFVIVCELVRIL
jgi:tyrosine-specific transport protein